MQLMLLRHLKPTAQTSKEEPSKLDMPPLHPQSADHIKEAKEAKKEVEDLLETTLPLFSLVAYLINQPVKALRLCFRNAEVSLELTSLLTKKEIQEDLPMWNSSQQNQCKKLLHYLDKNSMDDASELILPVLNQQEVAHLEVAEEDSLVERLEEADLVAEEDLEEKEVASEEEAVSEEEVALAEEVASVEEVEVNPTQTLQEAKARSKYSKERR